VLVCDSSRHRFQRRRGARPDGKQVLIAEQPAVEAVQFMYDTINKLKLSPSDVLSWDEEPSRRPFTAGQAAFLRNWSYVYAIARTRRNPRSSTRWASCRCRISPASRARVPGRLPVRRERLSKNQEAAVDFVTWMSSPAIQLRFAIELGIAPTRPAVYDDPSLIEKEPSCTRFARCSWAATPRPVTPKYSQVSLALQSAVSRALANGNVKEELESAKTRIAAIVG